MKKAIFKFGLFLLAVLLPIGCNSDDKKDQEFEIGIPISQIECEDNVTNFFNSALPYSSIYHYSDSFFCTPEEFDKNICYVINSNTELQNVCRNVPRNLLPEIDFSNQTLIVGQEHAQLGNKPKDLLKKTLYETETGYILSLYYNKFVMGSGSVDTFPRFIVYFWGIYPKLKNNNIIIKLSIKD